MVRFFVLYDGEKEVFYLFGGGVIFVTLFSYMDCYKESFYSFGRFQERWSIVGLVGFSLCECGQ